MAYSAAAGQRDFDVPFPYISRAHVQVRVNGTPTTITAWLSDTRVRLLSALTAGAVVEIERRTPIEEQLVQFQDGNILTAEDLNKAVAQCLFAQQEATSLYDRSLRQAQVRVGDALGVVSNPEDIAQELAELVLESDVLNEFQTRIGDIDLNANSIVAQTLEVDRIDGEVTATASALNSLSTTVAGNTATVSTLASSVNGLQARYGVALDVNGYVTGFLQNNDGSSGSFTILADRFAIVTPGASPQTPFEVSGGVVKIKEANIGSLNVEKLNPGNLNASITQNGDWTVGTGRIIWDNGTHMKVAGVGFGSTGQFIEWFGPKMDIPMCSEANAITYLKTNGDAYFGGSLSAGVLRNASQSSAIASNASVTIGPFGTNGSPITVVTSYSAESDFTEIYPDTSQGIADWDAAVSAWGANPSSVAAGFQASKAITCNVTVRVDRTIAGVGTTTGWATLTITGGTEFISGMRPTPGDSQGFITYVRTVSGSLTSTDSTGGTSNRTFTATITNRVNATLGNIVSQRVGLISTEE